jgi:hypothetical protein
MPHLEPFAIREGSMKDLTFVPLKWGKYDLECTVHLHVTFGKRAIKHEAHANNDGSREPYQER